MKDVNTGASSSSTGPAPKKLGRQKKIKNPENEIPKEESQKRPVGRPKKEPVNPDEPEKTSKSVKKTIKKEHGTKIELMTPSEWKEIKDLGWLKNQLDLRNIYLTKEEIKTLGKKGIVARIIDFDISK